MDDDIDEIIGDINADRVAGAAMAAAYMGTFLDAMSITAHVAIMMTPGGGAALLMGKLAMGYDIGWDDIAYAGLSVGGGAIIAKYGAKLGVALGRYAGKLGRRAWGWVRSSVRGLFGGSRTVCGFKPGELSKHFGKHAAKWFPPISSEAEYLRRASNLLSSPSGGSILEKVRPNGDILRYNTATNEFAAMASSGTIRTFFRPKNGINYWNMQ